MRWSGCVSKEMKTIALEEHFVTSDFLKATGAEGAGAPANLKAVRDALLDLGEARLSAMDEGGVDLQVLSLAAIGVDDLAPTQQTAVLRGVHDEVADAVRKHSDRFHAFATPAMKEPRNAAKELERCVREFGFKGALLDGTTEGKFLDDPRFLPVLEVAEAMNVPIYLHPAPPPAAVKAIYFSGLPSEVANQLSLAGWGWHAETGLHMLRLIVSGVMDRMPKLRIIVGHMGEGVPYALARVDGVMGRSLNHLQRSATQTFLDQFSVTTSGYFTRPPFDCCRSVLGLDRMMYSIDYPFSANAKGREFLDLLDLNSSDREAFVYGNAAKALRV